jgi:hypothetical protein
LERTSERTYHAENDAALVYEVMKKELHGRNHIKEGDTNI